MCNNDCYSINNPLTFRWRVEYVSDSFPFLSARLSNQVGSENGHGHSPAEPVVHRGWLAGRCIEVLATMYEKKVELIAGFLYKLHCFHYWEEFCFLGRFLQYYLQNLVTLIRVNNSEMVMCVLSKCFLERWVSVFQLVMAGILLIMHIYSGSLYFWWKLIYL